ncbi:MAG: hypothetical protein LBV63_04285 [Candidatus Methanoplasma sp.]|jgi:hypothetical protein|nr:hypothetical protein [Candidatus Methanoplasma sp.]
MDSSGKVIFVGECKHHERPVDIDVYFDLKKNQITATNCTGRLRVIGSYMGHFQKACSQTGSWAGSNMRDRVVV